MATRKKPAARKRAPAKKTTRKSTAKKSTRKSTAKKGTRKSTAKKSTRNSTAKKTARKSPAKETARKRASAPATRMPAPPSGVTVRMYRQGHGDCFLLACPRAEGGEPYYILIDCGLKPGSEAFLPHQRPIGDVVQHIHDSTGGRLDLVILTHEHQDHLNGIWRAKSPYFEPFEIREAWLSWTEDPENELANALRRRHRDQLLGLVAARNRLAMAFGAAAGSVRRLDELLSLETGAEGGVDGNGFAAAATDPSRSVNKQALKLVHDKAAASAGCYYLYPGEDVIDVEGTAGLRAYVLGPPESADLIADEDPQGDEAFPRDHGLSFAAAARADAAPLSPPFGVQFSVPQAAAPGRDRFFHEHYGTSTDPLSNEDRSEVEDNAPWRRIDDEWLFAADALAIKLNTGVNNTSVVIAFELPRTRKVLLFVGDAQRGSWRSWSDVECRDGDRVVTANDILRRTVLYKVGHHGSHNATLAGSAGDDYANLGWMGLGDFGREFTAMIPAVNRWAVEKNRPPWYHPLPSIRNALLAKGQGRVLQTDIDEPTKPSDASEAEWRRFTDRCTFEDLYFELTVSDT